MLVNLTNASIQLDLHPNTLRRLISSGQLSAVRIGRRLLIQRRHERGTGRERGTSIKL